MRASIQVVVSPRRRRRPGVAEVDFAGPGGDVELLGLFFTDPGQHHEHRIFVDHAQPHCRSNVNYKGALHGEGAHSVWIGDVLIRANAVGTETYEINRNLLLSAALGPTRCPTSRSRPAKWLVRATRASRADSTMTSCST